MLKKFSKQLRKKNITSNKITIEESASNIGIHEWNKLKIENPFMSYEFISSLEISGCVSENTGWNAQHVTMKDDENKILGIIPSYIKEHSYGEYVFDQSWAEFYDKLGLNYYPKLQSCIPFTPVTSRKLLLSEGIDDVNANTLAASIKDIVNDKGLSSAHLTFCTKDEVDILQRHNFLQRTSQQFRWENNNYQTFDNFLENLTSRKRKMIRKERKYVESSDIKIEIISGKDITDEHLDAFYRFYKDTCRRKWGHAYLNREFFGLIAEKMPDKMILILARFGLNYIASSLHIIGEDRLYGRYWGGETHDSFLHFELCFYQAIEYAICNKLQYIEAGAGGYHKISRGYVPILTYSAHYMNIPEIHSVVKDYLTKECELNNSNLKELENNLPYKKIL
ncbi:MAG: GNAT family N-acetyltransferase [Alphaproteobacteria bacterium]